MTLLSPPNGDIHPDGGNNKYRNGDQCSKCNADKHANWNTNEHADRYPDAGAILGVRKLARNRDDRHAANRLGSQFCFGGPGGFATRVGLVRVSISRAYGKVVKIVRYGTTN